MFQDENENPIQYTNNYDNKEAAPTIDTGTHAVLGQAANRNPEQYADPTAQNSGHYAVPVLPDYTHRPSGDYPVATQQDYATQASGNYPVATQQDYATQASESNQAVPQQNYASSSPSARSYPASGPQGYTPGTPGTPGNYPSQAQMGYIPPTSTPKKPVGIRTGAIIGLTLAIIIIFGIGLYAGWQYGGNITTTSLTANTTNANSSSKVATIPDTSTVQGQQEAAIAIIEPSVVELDVTTSQGEDIGSGVIINKSGDIITNNHVIAGGESIQAVLSNGKTETAQVVGTAASDDLAIVHIQPFANMTVATIGDSSKLIVGQEVLAVGNPLGITQTATRGIVSALNRSIQESSDTGTTGSTTAGATINNAIQTDAPINPGNSGGALINLQGQLIGIPTLTAVNTESNTDANGIGFAIPSSTVQTVIAQILK
jgi:S1-C subfamily serine protease